MTKTRLTPGMQSVLDLIDRAQGRGVFTSSGLVRAWVPTTSGMLSYATCTGDARSLRRLVREGLVEMRQSVATLQTTYHRKGD